MQFVYDFDGVLVETKAAIRMAWRKAGVEAPKDFWKRPWHTWCQDPEAYKRRDEHYLQCLGMVKLLPMIEVARATGGIILTNGSERRVLATLEHFKINSCIVKCGLDVLQKAEELNKFKEPGIYFEDNWENATIIRKLTKWKVILVNNQS